jgi:hypothetical protein
MDIQPNDIQLFLVLVPAGIFDCLNEASEVRLWNRSVDLYLAPHCALPLTYLAK